MIISFDLILLQEKDINVLSPWILVFQTMDVVFTTDNELSATMQMEHATDIIITTPQPENPSVSIEILIVACVAFISFVCMAMLAAWCQSDKVGPKKTIHRVIDQRVPPKYEVALKMPKPVYGETSDTKQGSGTHLSQSELFSDQLSCRKEQLVISDNLHKMIACLSNNQLPTYQEYISDLLSSKS